LCVEEKPMKLKSSLKATLKQWTKQSVKSQLKGRDLARDEDELLMNPTFNASDDDGDSADENSEVVNVEQSVLRNRVNATLEESDPRYFGKKVSRKDLNLQDEDEEDEDDWAVDETDGEEEVDDWKVADPEIAQQLEAIESGIVQDDDEEEDEEVGEQQITVIKKATLEERKLSEEKAEHVKNQRKIWDVCMDLRIKMEKPLLAANRLPSKEELDSILKEGEDNGELEAKMNQVQEKLASVLAKLERMRALLADESVEEDSSIDQMNFESEWQENIQPKLSDAKSTHLEDIDKWSVKTQLAQGKLSKTKGSLKALNQSVSHQINAAIEDNSRLLQRSRTPRIPVQKIRTEDAQEEIDQSAESLELKADTEIFDDADFYHKLLKELVSAGSEAIAGCEIDNLNTTLESNSTKKKPKDTKASKGRKVRYTVEPKLVNFMAPEPIRSDLMEISADIFMTMYKNNNAQVSN
jgi:protein AATF/BFR2